MLNIKIFSLHPQIFDSFFSTALIAKGLDRKVFDYKIYNWREEFGLGKYKQVDQQAFGGGSGMVLKPEPIFNALKKYDCLSSLFKKPEKNTIHRKIEPNNATFYHKAKTEKLKKATILLTPRGFTFNQKIANWLSKDFTELSFVCGRYEGFDARVSEMVDLELSLGDFVLGGGEVASMAMIEAITRLLPNFLIKTESKNHDSFSTHLNLYPEQMEYILGKNKISQKPNLKNKFKPNQNTKQEENLFSNQQWRKEKLPNIEHPHYTRPKTWQNFQTPEILLSGNHNQIQIWRESGWKTEL